MSSPASKSAGLSSGSAPRRRLEAITQQIAPTPTEAGTFEDIPRIRTVAGDAKTPRCKDKVVIITGCNSPQGIGRATAHLYAANGATAVYLCDFADQHLETHVREITALYPGCKAHARQFDASDEDKVAAVVKEAIDTYGRLDVFFANAGIVGNPTTFENIDTEGFMNTMKVNVLSVFLAMKHAAPAMKITSSSKPYSSGSIIGTASVAGIRSNAGSSDYSASKAAVVSLMQTGAYQLSRSNIRCNAICPGLIETGMTAPVFDSARDRGTTHKIGQINPMGRGAVADEVARVALFLGSDEASYVNGQAWAVCGGLSAGHPYVLGKLA